MQNSHKMLGGPSNKYLIVRCEMVTQCGGWGDKFGKGKYVFLSAISKKIGKWSSFWC